MSRTGQARGGSSARLPADQQALVKVAARVCSCKGPRERPVKTSECSEISTLRPRKLPQKHFGRPGSPAAAGGGKGFGAFGAFGASHGSGATLGACCPRVDAPSLALGPPVPGFGPRLWDLPCFGPRLSVRRV